MQVAEAVGCEIPRIGVLSVQGDYEAHGRVLRRLGVTPHAVRRPGDLAGLQGLVLPGGESTTMWHFLSQDGFAAAVQAFARRGGAVYGTCAGAILMARRVTNPAARGLDLLDIDVERNSYGRQVESAVRTARLEDTDDLEAAPTAGAAIEAVLIRAPRIRRVGPGLRVRARLDDDAVWVEGGRCMATTFHPELGTLEAPHRRFIALAMLAAAEASPGGSSPDAPAAAARRDRVR
jgi:5'-phosphate synthase pdxT subunit